MRLFISCLLSLLLCSHCALATSRYEAPNLVVSLISDHKTLSTSSAASVGVLFEPNPGWHVYWRNPGDTGLSPEITWQLPQGTHISDIVWAYPEAIPVAHLMNYGFHDTLLLPTQVSFKNQAPKAKKIRVGAHVKWLVCKESCIPGEAQLVTELNLGTEAEIDPQHHDKFNVWLEKVPKPLATMHQYAALSETELEIEIYAKQLMFKGAQLVEVFVENTDLVKYSAPQKITWGGNRLYWRQGLNDFFQTAPEEIKLVVVIDKQRAYRLTIPLTT